MLLNTIRNIRLLRAPLKTSKVFPKISVLVPARNEANSLPHLIESLRQQDFPNFDVVIMDDDSSDETYEVAANASRNDKRFRVIQQRSVVAEGWLGKSWACQQLSHEATGEILCFIDADVTLSPSALTRTLNLLYGLNVDVVCPYPRQVTTTFLSRLVQPLLQWSWMATLPLDLALKSPRTSLVAGNGQLLMIRRDMYEAINGHASVKDEVLEDLELVRAVKRAGGKGGVWDGSNFAECTMYTTNTDLIHGYAKSLWRAFGSIPTGVFVAISLLFLFLQPFVALVLSEGPSQIVALISVVASLLSRMLVHIQYKYPVSDALFYPFSFFAFTFLMLISCVRKLQGTIMWKGRFLNE
jgi:glycosyltransferase involved in cell wall biosynthesis